jgi:hypothetical protein
MAIRAIKGCIIMNPASQPFSASDSGFRGRWLHRLTLMAGSLMLWDCGPLPHEPPCYRDPDQSCYGDDPYSDPYPDSPQSGTPGDLPKGEREFALVLDPGLRIWFDAYDAVPRQVYIGNGPDAPSGLAHDLRETRPWFLDYAGRTETLFPSVSAWDHAGPTAHVRIRLNRSYPGDPLSLDLEIRHGFQGNSHVLIEAFQVHGLRDGESLVVQAGGEISRGRWLQAWSAGGNGYLRGPVGHEELWMPGNGYHEARVEFR